MITKRQLLEYCSYLANDIDELTDTVHKLQIEVALFHEKKNINPIKKNVKK